MEIKCNVIQDLLPLYVDNACSKESADMVTEHLESCSECKELYDKMCSLNEENILKDEFNDVITRYKKSIRRKKRFIISLISIAALIVSIFATGLTAYGVCFVIDRVQLKPLEIDYGESELFTKEEMDEVIELIKKEYEYDFFNSLRRKLFAINYTSDTYGYSVLATKNAYRPKNNKYTDCMVFTTEFKTSILGRHMIWLPNQYYTGFYYVFAKTKDGEWESCGGGFGPP